MPLVCSNELAAVSPAGRGIHQHGYAWRVALNSHVLLSQLRLQIALSVDPFTAATDSPLYQPIDRDNGNAIGNAIDGRKWNGKRRALACSVKPSGYVILSVLAKDLAPIDSSARCFGVHQHDTVP